MRNIYLLICLAFSVLKVQAQNTDQVTLNVNGSHLLGDTIAFSAYASSGLALTLTVDGNVTMIDSFSFVGNAVEVITITASHDGNDTYLPASATNYHLVDKEHLTSTPINECSPALKGVVMGSSTAYGSGAWPREEHGWAFTFEDSLKALNPSNTIINIAASGKNSFQLMPTGHNNGYFPSPQTDYNISNALSFQPDFLIINLPSNDASSLFPLERTLENLVTMFNLARANGIVTYITTTQPRNFANHADRDEKIALQQTTRDQINNIFGLYALDFWTQIEAEAQDGTINPIYDADGAHLNNLGHYVLRDIVAAKDIPSEFNAMSQFAAYLDYDQDGYGDVNQKIMVCILPAGYSLDATDCDDNDNTIYPGATEIADDGIDQDCDGSDLVQDADQDGFDVSVDCDDNDASIGLASVWYKDNDGDGHGDLSESLSSCTQPAGYVVNSTDCDDNDNTIYPGATEVADDGIDQDCDGSDLVQDADQDGFDVSVDCDDNDATIGLATVWYKDNDGDGHGDLSESLSSCTQPTGYVGNADDCDDNDNTIYPGATEIADDGIDQDCDGSDLVQDADQDGFDVSVDCDDNDATIGLASVWYKDNDGDGHGDLSESLSSCTQPAGYVVNSTDCDDNDNTIYPGATEVADDGIDQDCDGSDLVQDADQDGFDVSVDCDDNDATIGLATVWYKDNDGDGHGDLSESLSSCTQPTGYVGNADDCDDNDNTIYPGATEIADDGIDQDCDGSDLVHDADQDGFDVSVDCDDNDATIGLASVWYKDNDSDGHGDLSESLSSCQQPAGYVGNADDCDDSDNTIHPGATEIADDGIDQDCDGFDLVQDADQDGFDVSVDCDDNDATIGLASVWYKDNDGDGHGDLSESLSSCTQPVGYVINATDCNDNDSTIFPGATEIADDGIDQDCDGSDLVQDADQDGFDVSVDCDDNDAAIGLATVWYKDNDGDGHGDLGESLSSCTQPAGYVVNSTDCDDNDNTIYPGATEVADDGIDQDCDGSDLVQDADQDGFDVSVDCDDNDVTIGLASVWYKDNDGDGHGDLSESLSSCAQPAGYVVNADDCDDNDNTIYPGATEVADDGIDQDCDGSDLVQDADQDGFDVSVDCDDNDATIGLASVWYKDNDGDGHGDLSESLSSCTQPVGYVINATDCNDNDSTIFPGATEIADDGIDQDCDGSDLVQDGDQDGFDVSVDCDDNDAAIGLATVWYKDNDGDGHGDLGESLSSCTQPAGYVVNSTDCDDNDNTIYPGATEVADDGIDQDCDGSDLVRDADQDGFDVSVDCDDNDATIGLATVWYKDNDGDGQGDLSESLSSCTQPAGYVVNSTDCDDNDNTIYPGATEIADDGIDQDCDGSDLIRDSDQDGFDISVDCDDNDATIGLATVWYKDNDGDGHGDLGESLSSCTQPAGYVVNSTDCDDNDNTIYPGATEVADDGIDQDCDGSDLVQDADRDGFDASVDCDDNDATIGLATVWYKDNDGDGHGDLSESLSSCQQPDGYVVNSTDCDDSDNTIYPGATEIADDGIDQDCDGSDLVQDADQDGFDASVDCDDNDATIGLATVWYKDNDGDGHGDLSESLSSCQQPSGYVVNSTDCDDNDNTIHPGATEVADDGIDQDCDGSDLVRDADQDGFDVSVDCDDNDAAIGLATVWYKDNDGDGHGDLSESLLSCQQPDGYVVNSTDCDDSDNTIYPGATEVADDGIDQDCDGSDLVRDADQDGFDVSVDCDDNDAAIGLATVWYKDNDGDGHGDLSESLLSCQQPDGYVVNSTDCDDSDNTIYPGAAEIADDGIDQDCDGSDLVQDADQDGFDVSVDCDDNDATIGLASVWYKDNDSDGHGDLSESLSSCQQPTGYVVNSTDCDDRDNMIYPGATEVADDGIDQDCDGSDLVRDADQDGFDVSVDCDDNDASIGLATVWYKDNDDDGHGDLGETLSSCQQPTGYVINAADCDDSDNTIYPGATEIADDGIDQDCDGSDLVQDADQDGFDLLVDCDDNDATIGLASVWYKDNDGDGHGDLSESLSSCTQPAGYVGNADDCDDNDSSIQAPKVWYIDLDGDGFGSATGVVIACNVPDGYVANQNDCDDSSSLYTLELLWYRDQDADGYGNVNQSIMSCRQPEGYINNSIDCDDTDAKINPQTIWFIDTDKDGFGTESVMVSSCEQPAGYVSNGDDCDDKNAEVSADCDFRFNSCNTSQKHIWVGFNSISQSQYKDEPIQFNIRQGRIGQRAVLNVQTQNAANQKVLIAHNSKEFNAFGLDLSKSKTIEIVVENKGADFDFDLIELGIVGESYGKVNVGSFVNSWSGDRYKITIPVSAFNESLDLESVKYLEFPIIKGNNKVDLDITNISFSGEDYNYEWLSYKKSDLLVKSDDGIRAIWDIQQFDQEITHERIEIYLADSLLTVLHQSPYQFDWQTETAGIYQFVARSYQSDGTICSDPFNVTVVDRLLTTDPDLSEFKFKVYPNPGAGEIQMEFNSLFEGAAEIQILDASSRVVTTKSTYLSKGIASEIIDISSQNSGLYLVRAIIGNEAHLIRYIKR